MNKLFVGIDVSSQNNVSYLMDSDGVKYSSFSVQNNLGGAKLLTEKIVSAMETLKLSDVVIGMESTSIYGNHLVHSLREDGTLGRYQRKIHVLNPKQVSKSKKAYPDLPKNDWVDAFVIADCLRFGRIRSEVYMDDYRYEALKTLTRARFYAVQNLAREKQRFANLLFLKCSGLAQSADIKNTSSTVLSLMEEYETVDDLANADLEDLTVFVTAAGRGRFADPENTAKTLQAAARGSHRLPQTINDSVNQAMSVSIATMRSMKEQIKVLEKAIEQQFEIMIKSGNRFLRYYLLEAANSVRGCDPEFQRYYGLKYHEVNKGQHKRALALTARKLVRLVFRLLKDNRLYNRW